MGTASDEAPLSMLLPLLKLKLIMGQQSKLALDPDQLNQQLALELELAQGNLLRQMHLHLALLVIPVLLSLERKELHLDLPLLMHQ